MGGLYKRVIKLYDDDENYPDEEAMKEIDRMIDLLIREEGF